MRFINGAAFWKIDGDTSTVYVGKLPIIIVKIGLKIEIEFSPTSRGENFTTRKQKLSPFSCK
jgi:hypothetical protein